MPKIRFYEDSKYYELIKYFEYRKEGRILPSVCGIHNNEIAVHFISNKDGNACKVINLPVIIGQMAFEYPLKNTYEYNYVLRSIAKDNFEVSVGIKSEQDTKWWYIKDDVIKKYDKLVKLYN